MRALSLSLPLFGLAMFAGCLTLGACGSRDDDNDDDNGPAVEQAGDSAAALTGEGGGAAALTLCPDRPADIPAVSHDEYCATAVHASASAVAELGCDLACALSSDDPNDPAVCAKASYLGTEANCVASSKTLGDSYLPGCCGFAAETYQRELAKATAQ